MLNPQKKVNTPKSIYPKGPACAYLERVALANWVSYAIVLEVSSEIAKRQIRDIGQLSKTEIKKVTEKVKKEGWRLRK